MPRSISVFARSVTSTHIPLSADEGVVSGFLQQLGEGDDLTESTRRPRRGVIVTLTSWLRYPSWPLTFHRCPPDAFISLMHPTPAIWLSVPVSRMARVGEQAAVA